ncbi:branched-chain amino acid ABC transporter permease [Ruegeria sp.]|uniref:branched-chain amino acid ABC transporter permease n=1 Tax=Ruegeria sp. TaxID=1879320 RepID=UPI002328199A|nr:branched-chain amino acid ABC transporter permease [Ruegeria sp.]MDA7966426.1 branched-chain amino acid ABC transporter permease [Ruegeria sp.]
MTSIWLNQIIQGILVGGLYALYASGLSLSVGILRFVNIAHGDLIILACFAQFLFVVVFGIPPVLAACVLVVVCAIVAWLMQKYLLDRILHHGIMPTVLVTFGISICIQNSLLGVFDADSRKVPAGDLDIASVALTDDVFIGVLPMLIFLSAVALIFVLNYFLFSTQIGTRIRAVAENPDTANLMGLPTGRLYAVSMAMVGVSIGLTAVFLSIWTNFDASAGQSRLLIAFEVVVLGGLGSLWGTLIGGIILGVAQAVGAQFDAGWQALSGHIVFLAIFLVRPRGLFPRD